MTYVNATVKYGAGKVLQTQNGPRINAVLTTEQGQEVKLWADAGDPEIGGLRKNQKVQLSHDGRSYSLVAPSHGAFGGGAPAQQPQQQAATPQTYSYSPGAQAQVQASPKPEPWGPEHVDQLNNAIARRAWVLRRCNDEIVKSFTDPATGECLVGEETRRSLIATLYIDLESHLD